ncbi:MAG TPA: single-stranded-DNA-specific exonuclease RecJ [Candidatus Limnocylindrales bacterium]
MIVSTHRWRLAESVPVDSACRLLAAERGISRRLLALLAIRGVATADDLTRFLAPAEDGLHDPWLLPDAGAALLRVAQARERGEKILVYGDFDADGLTGLSILVLAFRHLGLDAEPYVPERLGDGHGLSLRAIDRAVAESRTLIVTADCGTSSGAEIDLAKARGIDVLVTDHHHAPSLPAGAVAVVNPAREDSQYPERRLTGAGVAWKFAHLLVAESDGTGKGGPLPQAVKELADLALIGTVADVAPILGENRCIAQLGLEQLRVGGRVGLAALMDRAGVARDRLDLDDIGFAIAPRLNAAGRMGEAGRAAKLLLARDPAVAAELAVEIETANLSRRELTKSSILEAKTALGLEADDTKPPEARGETGRSDLPAAFLVRGTWPVGIIGLIAGRLAEDYARPVVVATTLVEADGTLRASCRSGGGIGLAEALVKCSDLLIRHGGHEAAAGFDIEAARWPEFVQRFEALAAAETRPTGAAELTVDLVLAADSVDYTLVQEIARLAPTGPGNPAPAFAFRGLTVSRVRAANGGHTQLVLRRSRDVIDGIAFRRADLATMLHEGDRIDVVARPSSRRFGGFESIQLEIMDVSAEGGQPGLRRPPEATDRPMAVAAEESR